MIINNINGKTRFRKIKQALYVSLFLSTSIATGILNANAVGTINTCPQSLNIAPTAITTSKFSGIVNPSGSPTTAWFEYGTDEDMITNTGFNYIGKTNVETEVRIEFKNLKPNTKYFYKIVSENDYGVTEGETRTFKTLNL